MRFCWRRNKNNIDIKNIKIYNKFFPNGAGSIFTFDIKGGASI